MQGSGNQVTECKGWEHLRRVYLEEVVEEQKWQGWEFAGSWGILHGRGSSEWRDGLISKVE